MHYDQNHSDWEKMDTTFPSESSTMTSEATNITNKTKVISADLLDFAFDLDFYFEDIFKESALSKNKGGGVGGGLNFFCPKAPWRRRRGGGKKNA